MTVDDEIKSMQADITALADAWIDRGLPPAAIAGVLSAQGNIYLLELGCRLKEVIESLTEMWTVRGGEM